MNVKGRSFEDFYTELEAETRAEGKEAIADLRAKELKYGLLNSLLSRRHTLHLTQKQLAERSGIAQTEISRVERGRKSPNLDTYCRLAAALGLKLAFGAPEVQSEPSGFRQATGSATSRMS